MNDITWIIEKNIFDEKCVDDMLYHFQINDIPYHVVSIVPFTHEIDGGVPDIKTKYCILYTSIGTQKLAKENNWFPGIWTNDQFNEKTMIENLELLSLNSYSYFMKLSEVSDFFKRNNFRNDRFFIKPNTDTKEFAGTVISVKGFNDWYKDMMNTRYLENDNFDVMISKPEKILTEYRTIIVDGKACECSIYKKDGRHVEKRCTDEWVLTFAERCAKIFSPADVFVMDIVDTPRGYRVLEYGTFNHAGLYDCNVGNIIRHIHKFIRNNDMDDAIKNVFEKLDNLSIDMLKSKMKEYKNDPRILALLYSWNEK